MAGQHTVAVVFGTRPEAIKLLPVVRALESGPLKVVTVATGQHREMLDQVLEAQRLTPTIDLDVMRQAQSLNLLAARLLTGLDAAYAALEPDLVVVQGDTTSALIGAQAAFHRRLPVAHVEAGLRSGDPDNPYPEETNRRLISTLATLHFPPTARARKALLDEGRDSDSIAVTGNTAVDALLQLAPPASAPTVADRRLLVVTTHRRESFDGGLERVFRALLDIVEEHSDVDVVFPVHLNPKVHELAWELLGNQPRIRLIEPLSHDQFVPLMRSATLLLTDSGGVQEEAPSLDKPVLLLREVTERCEALEAGAAVLVGTNRERIVEETRRLLTDDEAYRRMASIPSPFGDGRAAHRIARAIERWSSGESPLLPADEEFG